MTRASLLLLLLFVHSALRAQSAPGPHWEKVVQLPVGLSIAVLERGHQYPTSCHMDSADNTTLACISEFYETPKRLVFPISRIAAVYTEEITPDPDRRSVLLGTAIGAGIGAAVGSTGGIKTGLIFSALGAGMGAGIASQPPSHPGPPRIRRRLIYSSP